MKRFDLCRDRGDPDQFLLVIQSDFHTYLPTVIVIPVIPIERVDMFVKTIYLPLTIRDQNYYIATSYMTAVGLNQLGPKVDNLEHFRDDITQSIDFLLQGF